jgi:hypothetical protein
LQLILKNRLAKSENLLTDQRSDTERAQLQAEQAKPTLKTRKRRLTLRERLFGGEVSEVEGAV